MKDKMMPVVFLCGQDNSLSSNDMSDINLDVQHHVREKVFPVSLEQCFSFLENSVSRILGYINSFRQQRERTNMDI